MGERINLGRGAARSLGWAPVGACVVAAVAAGWQDASLVAACALALGLAGVVDEPAPELAVSAPTPALLVRGLRLALVVPAVAAAYMVAGRLSSVPGPGAVELGALVALSLAAAAAGARLRPGLTGSAVAGPALLAVLLDGGRYLDGDPAWLALAATSVAVLAVATRDPGAPTRRASSNTLAVSAANRL